MTTISERLREDICPGASEAFTAHKPLKPLRHEAADTIDALVAALEDVRLRVSGNSVGESTVKQIDAALALARKGGRG